MLQMLQTAWLGLLDLLFIVVQVVYTGGIIFLLLLATIANWKRQQEKYQTHQQERREREAQRIDLELRIIELNEAIQAAETALVRHTQDPEFWSNHSPHSQASIITSNIQTDIKSYEMQRDILVQQASALSKKKSWLLPTKSTEQSDLDGYAQA